MNRKQERERKIIARMSCGHGRDYKWCYRPDLDSVLERLRVSQDSDCDST